MRNFMMSGSQVAYDADDGTGGGGTGTGDGGTGDAKWYAGADAELIGHIQTKGWHDLTPDKAALAAIQAHREAEKFVGVPADRIIKLPATPEDPAWADVYGRLGAPKTAAEYDFSSVKVNDEPADPALVEFFRTQAAALHLPKDAAPALLDAYLKHQNGIGAAAAAEKTAKLAEEHKVLDANWGANAEANKFLARKGAEKLGLDATAVDALEGVVGYAKTMEALRKVGEISGEAKFIGGNGMTQDGIMTREQAVARKAELMADGAWTKRYMDGGSAEAREMTALLTLIVGDDTASSAQR
jgi:hypothetical protein